MFSKTSPTHTFYKHPLVK